MEILKKHSTDLSRVDLNIIDKDIKQAESNLKNGKDKTIILEHLSRVCNDKTLVHPEWSIFSGRILMETIHQIVNHTFTEGTRSMSTILDPSYHDFVTKNGEMLESFLRPERDYSFNIFAVATLKKSYLAHLKVADKSYLMETPQYMYLRVATYLHFPDLHAIKETYESLSKGLYSQATPTLFNAGMKRPQLSSCFLGSVSDDMQGITKSWHDQAIISMNSGGLGYDFSSIRHSEIGQHGLSSGVTPWLKITNEVVKTVDQCFAPDTIVYTSKGPRCISSVVPGTKLIREDGSFGRVSKLLGYEVNLEHTTLYNFKIKHAYEPVIVAGCHPLLSFKYKSGSGSFKQINEMLDKQKIIPEYIDVEYLDKDYFVAIPIPTYTKDIEYITPQDCRFYGIMLGDGYINSKRNEMKVYLNNTTKKDTCSFVKSYLESKGISYWSGEKNNCTSFGWAPNPKTFPFSRKMLYTKTGEKRICSSMINLPVEKSLQIFKGVMETDGTYRSGGEIQIEQTSKPLADALCYILLRAQVPTSGNVRDRVGSVSNLKRGGTITTKKITYNLRIPKTPKICSLLDRDDPSDKLSYFIYDGKIWSRVFSKEIVGPKEEKQITQIYDIEMENKNNDDSCANYLTSIGLAHNGGKRKGSCTVYNRVWHVDIYEFIELRDEGPEDMRAKDLFLALMVDDLFMERVKNDQEWSLFCPNKAKGLADSWGQKFEELYYKYEKNGIASSVVKARDLWKNILTMQIKKGMPFLIFMDAINFKSNQKHSGMIRCSNLCTEIALNTGPDEIASCILGSIALNKCVQPMTHVELGKDHSDTDLDDRTSTPPDYKIFDFEMLERMVAEEVRNKNNVIDRNYYPRDIPEIRYSNMRHRPIGIGVQGYADTLAMLDLSWVVPNPYYDKNDIRSQKYLLSPELKKLNADIFETMYYAAVRESIALAKIYGHYETFKGSPASKGEFQFDMWKNGANKQSRYTKKQWDDLRQDMIRHGLRNSTLLAIMPTASSAHILGNQEACEPFNELIYARSVLSGQFMLVNKHMVEDLRAINLWDDKTVKTIIKSKGSLQNVILEEKDERNERLDFLKIKYLTVFEIPQACILELGADRGIYICQTESRNCHMASPTRTKLNAYHFGAWEFGLKTGMYYLRQKSRSDPINFSANDQIIPAPPEVKITTQENGRRKRTVVCTDDVCMSCNA